MQTTIATTILSGFDDPRLSRERWSELLRCGDTDGVNLTWEWQRSWWKSFGHGKLLLVAAESDGQIVAIAPLFADGGMIFNLCPEDCLDFVGDISDPDLLVALLETARGAVPDFVGFQFYFIPDTSRTCSRLSEAARCMGLNCCEMNEIPSPLIDLRGKPQAAVDCTRKQSLVRHENALRRAGNLTVHHFRAAEDILPNLPLFFEQHIRRRAATPNPSLFYEERQRAYYLRLTQELSHTGWLWFTRIDLDGRPIAFHYGLCYRGRYLYGIPSFEVEMSRQSPGEVLLRHLLLAAIEEGASTFDFGIGDEAYKYRFATDVVQLRTMGLFPLGKNGEARP